MSSGRTVQSFTLNISITVIDFAIRLLICIDVIAILAKFAQNLKLLSNQNL